MKTSDLWKLSNKDSIPAGYVCDHGAIKKEDAEKIGETIDPRYTWFVAPRKVDYFDENHNFLSSGIRYILFVKE